MEKRQIPNEKYLREVKLKETLSHINTHFDISLPKLFGEYDQLNTLLVKEGIPISSIKTRSNLRKILRIEPAATQDTRIYSGNIGNDGSYRLKISGGFFDDENIKLDASVRRGEGEKIDGLVNAVNEYINLYEQRQ